jgi:hypothetical protein
MLMKFGKLSKDGEIGAFLVGAGRTAIMGSLLASAWILRIMATTQSPAASDAPATRGPHAARRPDARRPPRGVGSGWPSDAHSFTADRVRGIPPDELDVASVAWVPPPGRSRPKGRPGAL